MCSGTFVCTCNELQCTEILDINKAFNAGMIQCVVGQKNKEKKTKHPCFFFNTNYRTEMKLVPIIMHYCLLQFDALKFFLSFRLHGGSQPNFKFFVVNLQICQRNHKVHLTNCLEKNVHNISNISLRIFRVGIIANARM